jgi:hypothetical protein
MVILWHGRLARLSRYAATSQCIPSDKQERVPHAARLDKPLVVR